MTAVRSSDAHKSNGAWLGRRISRADGVAKVTGKAKDVTSREIISIAFSPLVGGAVTAELGWRWLFLLEVPLAFIALVSAAVAAVFVSVRPLRTVAIAPLLAATVATAL